MNNGLGRRRRIAVLSLFKVAQFQDLPEETKEKPKISQLGCRVSGPTFEPETS
jgi:hypothetical protein